MGIIKILVMLILFVPAMLIALVIWVFGGWTKGWDYMPNPVDTLIDWVER